MTVIVTWATPDGTFQTGNTSADWVTPWGVMSDILGTSTETVTATLALGPMQFASAGAAIVTGTASLAIAKMNFAGSLTARVTGTASLAIAAMKFAATGTPGDTGTASLAIAKMLFNAPGAVSRSAHTNLALGPMKFNAAAVASVPAHATLALGPFAFAASDAFARATQLALPVLSYSGVPVSRLTQFALNTLGENTVNARSTQMALLVLAKGGDTPLTPDPLSLHDGGREMTMRSRLVNMYPEPTPQGPGTDARYQRGGLYSAAVRGGGPIQMLQHWAGPLPVVGNIGAPATNEFLYSVSAGNVYRDSTNIGTVDPFIDPKWFPKGRRIVCARSETQFMIVSNGNLYSADLDTVVEVPIAGNLPAGVRDVAFLSGRFVYILDDNSGEFYYSELGDGTTIGGLNFATASEDDPHPTIAVWDLSDDIIFFTSETAEFWYASADANNPYQRSIGRRYNKGLLAQHSVELLDNSLFWLGHDRVVYRTGMSPQRVSNFDIEDRIRRLGDEEVQQCYSHGVTFGGHNFYVIHLMSQGTWALDIASGTWAEWKSWEKDRYRVFCSDDTNRLFGDYYSGNLMGMDGKVYNDMGDPLERICSAYYPLQKGRATNFNAILHCMRGPPNSIGQGFNPSVEMRFSDAEGHDWTTWWAEEMGTPGDRGEGSKVVWDQLGGRSPPGRLFEFRCTHETFFAPYKLRVDEERP